MILVYIMGYDYPPQQTNEVLLMSYLAAITKGVATASEVRITILFLFLFVHVCVYIMYNISCTTLVFARRQ